MSEADKLTMKILKEKDIASLVKTNIFVVMGHRTHKMNPNDKELYYAEANIFIDNLRKKNDNKKNKLQKQNRKPRPKRLQQKKRR